MSGGSFDYLCYKDIDELFQYDKPVQEMADQLAQLGYAQDAAKETEAFLLELRAFKNRIIAKQERLQSIWKAVEWWVSGDYSGEEAIQEALQKYREA